MLIEKLYAETLDVQDPENYSADPERYLTTYLRRRFEGHCRKGAYIVRIIEIVRRSACRMKETDLSAEGYVDVEFRAEVSLLAQWDILTGVVVASRAQLIVGKSEVEGVTVATLLPTPEAETVREGQTISIRVLKAQYNADQAQATAVGPLLTCDKAAPTYKVAGSLTPEDARALAPLAARVKALLEARAVLVEGADGAASRRDDLAFFEGLLYSYPRAGDGAPQRVESKGAEAWEGPAGYPLPAGTEAVNILDLVDEALEGGANVTGLWSRDLVLHRSSPLVAKATGAAPARWGPPAGATPRTAFASMLKTVHDFLKAANEMVAVYDSLEAIQNHKNIWLVMRGAQLPPP
jgi:hypothetical protein